MGCPCRRNNEDPETVVPILLEYVTGQRSALGDRQSAMAELSRYREQAADAALSWIDPE